MKSMLLAVVALTLFSVGSVSQTRAESCIGVGVVCEGR
jgi:hypothetical protein